MLPKVIIHNAISTDGRVDWFAADIGKFYESVAVWKEDATLAGSDTLLKAYPEERIPPVDEEAFKHQKENPQDARPLLVIPDSRGRLIQILPLLKHEPYWRDIIIFVSGKTPGTYLEYLEKRHIKYIQTGDERINYQLGLEELNSRYGVEVVRVDSGGTLNGVLLRAGLVNEVSVLIHPCLVGGTTPRSMYRAPDLTDASGVIQLHLTHFEKVADDLLWLRYQVVRF